MLQRSGYPVFVLYRSMTENLRTSMRTTNFIKGFLPPNKWFEHRDKPMVVNQNSVKPAIEQRVSVKCGEIPVNTWNKFTEVEDLDKRLIQAINNLGHSDMSPVQKYTFDILNRRATDVLASAETGSGKTLAFLAPIFNSMLREYPAEAMHSLQESNGHVNYPLFLVVAPTRELVHQICQEAAKLTNYTHLRVCNVIGGVSMSAQLDYLRNGCHAVIATPGRLLDLMNQGVISMRHCTAVVFDEADRMLDMGFEPQIFDIMHSFDMPPAEKLQLSMFSATFPDDVMQLVNRILKPDYATVLIGNDAGSDQPTVPSSISQHFQMSSNSTLYADILSFLQNSNQKTLVFCNFKADVNYLQQLAHRRRLRASFLCGSMSQRQRDMNLESFKSNNSQIMFATSVAARGLDVADIEVVVNARLPMYVDDYIHRAGRCGRMGRVGRVVTFLVEGDEDKKMVHSLVGVLKRCNQEVPPELTNRSRRPPTGQFVPGKGYRNTNYGGGGGGNNYNHHNNNHYQQQQQSYRPRQDYGGPPHQGQPATGGHRVQWLNKNAPIPPRFLKNISES